MNMKVWYLAAAALAVSLPTVQAGGALPNLLSVKGGNQSLVNARLGGDNLVAVRTGGVLGEAAPARVTLLGKNGVADVRIGVAGVANVRANVGTGGVGACVRLIGPTCPGGAGPGTTPGGTGPGGPDAGGVGVYGAFSAGTGACLSDDDQQAMALLRKGHYDMSVFSAWARARSVDIIPVLPCPAVRQQLAAAIKQTPELLLMQYAAAGDALIAATLSRTSYDANDILAVQSRGRVLQVYVY